MKLILSVLVFLLIYTHGSYSQKISDKGNARIIIEGQMPPEYKGDVIKLTAFPLDMITYHSEETMELEGKIAGNYVKWVFYFHKPVGISSPFTGNPLINYCLEPGDSVAVAYNLNRPVFSGKGAVKFDLIYRLQEKYDSLKNVKSYKQLSRIYTPIVSLNEYFLWNKYLNSQLDITLGILEEYRGRVSKFVYNTVKETALSNIENNRLNRFSFLIGIPSAGNTLHPTDSTLNQFGLTNEALCAIYDSTLYGTAARWLQTESSIVGNPEYLYQFVRMQAYRERGKFFNTSALDTPILAEDKGNDYLIRYTLAKNRFHGVIREEVLSYFFHSPVGALRKIGFEPAIEAMLADYYQQPGYEKYKIIVKKCEIERRRILAERNDLGFSLTDINGNKFNKELLRGKIAVLHFWSSSCRQCTEFEREILNIQRRFSGDTNVVFLGVSIDESKEVWINSIRRKGNSGSNELNLYTGGEGANHKFIRDFGIDGYPSFLLFDALGNPIYPKFNLDNRAGDELVTLIEKQLVLMKDGPYIKYDGGKVICSKINGTSVLREIVNTRAPKVEVQTDKLKNNFTVLLKDSMVVEPVEFPMPAKLIALSDIEGNFDVMCKLLITNGVIDESYNWSFGNGHLVFIGDMFDRGSQVTECLWLLYKLEEEAKRSGGYVHFVLGNHEIMNMQGKVKYAREKYIINAGLMNDSVAGLYGGNSELGRWLRTKNVVEKIGDLLFVHAGISDKLNAFSLADINKIARTYYGDKSIPNDNVQLIMGIDGPFWYRGYYKNKRRNNGYIDTTLERFSVDRIVTGHTIVNDNITAFHDGKVINIDTDHGNGKSEALLVEKGIYYSVDVKGDRRLLFSDFYQKALGE